MTNQLTIPQCQINVFPFEGGGGGFSIRGGQILTCRTSKSLTEMAGSFEIALAPGGPPFGVESQKTWAEVITPMSLVLIGMSRWQYSEIVMIGVVLDVAETQAWGERVERAVVISGEDFGHFFAQQNWLNLFQQLPGYASFIIPGAGGVVAQATGGFFGAPEQAGLAYFNNFMAGTNGVLADLTFQYNGTALTFPESLFTAFDPYPGFVVPAAFDFIAAAGSWEGLFKSIFQAPFYEFYVITAPVGSFATAGAEGTDFVIPNFGPNQANIFVVGRINPVPRVPVTISGGANGTPTFGQIDLSLWNDLALFQPDSGFIESGVYFGVGETRNFYMVNPTALGQLRGSNNQNNQQFAFSFTTAFDPASIHRYGYRPFVFNTLWMTDPNGNFAQGGATDPDGLVADMVGRCFSQYTPLSLMARGNVRYPLRPDILPGNRFRYRPFKNDFTWDFYITAVSHEFVFGARSMTTLTLERGLPTNIYTDARQASLLTQIHLGNAMRFEGGYTIGLPSGIGAGLQAVKPFQADPNMAQQLGQIARSFTTPQAP